MNWKNKAYASVYDAVNTKSGGRADEFLNGTGKLYRIQNLDTLGTWIKFYVANNLTFYIVGDYDCDGVMSTVELYILLKKIGAENIIIRTPKRPEGYGMSPKIVSEFDKPGVIITVDNGIAALPAIEEAKKRGHIVLVTDHHMPVTENGKEKLPAADLIVDAHVRDDLVSKDGSIAGTDFDGYCGAGIVYKLAQLLIPATKELDMIAACAAIATIADVVPLVEDNRNIFHAGMNAILSKRITPGLQKLIDVLKSNNIVNETDIGFTIAPMLNAPGRIYPDGANLSVNTVLSDNFYEADDLVAQLGTANESRKEMKELAVSRAIETMERECLYGDNPVVIYDPATEEGVVGLVAGALTEQYKATSIVFTKTENHGIHKGSCRAPEYCNIKQALDMVHDQHPEYFVDYGGHKPAAGVTLYQQYLDDFTRDMQDVMGPAQMASDCIEYDLEIDAGDLAGTTAQINQYAPYGEGNPALIVRVNNFRLVPMGNTFCSILGKDTIRFFGAGCEAIGFGLANRYEEEHNPMKIDIVGKLSYNNFMGKKVPQIEMLDFKASVSAAMPVSELSSSISDQLKLYGLA